MILSREQILDVDLSAPLSFWGAYLTEDLGRIGEYAIAAMFALFLLSDL